MKLRSVVLSLSIALVLAGSWFIYTHYQLHKLIVRENDVNPVAAQPVAGIRPLRLAPVPFERRVIDDRTFEGGRKAKVIINPDGRDAVVGAQVGPLGFALYRPGHPPAWITRFSKNDGAEDAQAADVSADGAPDIVVGGLGDMTYVLLNPLHTACSDVYECPWEQVVVDREHTSHDVLVGDVDRNGAVDIVTEGGVYFNQDRGRRWSFAGRALISRDGEGTSLGALDSDKILDIVAPYDSGAVLARFVNPLHDGKDPSRNRWAVQVIDPHPLFRGNMTTAIADINGDGRNDILLAPMYGGGGLVWYEAPPVPSGSWRRHTIDASINFVHQGSLQLADFNGNGHADIAFAEQDQSPTRRVGVFYNVKGDGSTWRLQVLSTEAGHNIKVGRLGKDRRPSIVSARHGAFGNTDPLVVWRDVLRDAVPAPSPSRPPRSPGSMSAFDSVVIIPKG